MWLHSLVASWPTAYFPAQPSPAHLPLSWSLQYFIHFPSNPCQNSSFCPIIMSAPQSFLMWTVSVCMSWWPTLTELGGSFLAKFRFRVGWNFLRDLHLFVQSTTHDGFWMMASRGWLLGGGGGGDGAVKHGSYFVLGIQLDLTLIYHSWHTVSGLNITFQTLCQDRRQEVLHWTIHTMYMY